MSDCAGAVLTAAESDAPREPVAPEAVVGPLLAWSEQHLRDLPWRRTRDPWAVLVSEVMLQQTQVSRVVERWHAFLARFPDPVACAEAPAADVIALWAGLGYNRRAVNLWRAAGVIRDRHGGRIPADLSHLLELPGVGPYTARAVAVFAFEDDVGVVDTNVGRLLARWTGRRLRPREAQVIADELVPPGDSWRWNQSLFDFADAVCRKRAPSCVSCPLQGECEWRGDGEDPAAGSAAVSTRQSRFEGSKRQVRGRILDAARDGAVPRSELRRLGRDGDSVAELDEIVAGLVADGLVVLDGGVVRLPR